MTGTEMITGKIEEVKDEMKKTGLWKKQSPSWVYEYQKVNIATEQEFSDWLQFVYLPNLMQRSQKQDKLTGNYIVPQAIHFFGEDIKKGRLLQLLIELDALP